MNGARAGRSAVTGIAMGGVTEAMPPDRGRVLVVDDDPLVRETLAARLEAWGFGAHTAPDAESAMAHLERRDPLAALVDLVLPGRSGLDLLREIRHRNGEAAVVLITAHGGLRAAREALLEGAEDVLTKPLRPERLRAVLETVLAGGRRCAASRTAAGRDQVGGTTARAPRRSVTPELPLGGWARRAEKDLFEEALRRTGGDEAEAARRMNLPPDVFRAKLTRYE